MTFRLSGPTLSMIVESTKKGFVVLCRSAEDARLMWQAAYCAQRGVGLGARARQQALYVAG